MWYSSLINIIIASLLLIRTSKSHLSDLIDVKFLFFSLSSSPTCKVSIIIGLVSLTTLFTNSTTSYNYSMPNGIYESPFFKKHIFYTMIAFHISLHHHQFSLLLQDYLYPVQELLCQSSINYLILNQAILVHFETLIYLF